LKDPHL